MTPSELLSLIVAPLVAVLGGFVLLIVAFIATWSAKGARLWLWVGGTLVGVGLLFGSLAIAAWWWLGAPESSAVNRFVEGPWGSPTWTPTTRW